MTRLFHVKTVCLNLTIIIVLVPSSRSYLEGGDPTYIYKILTLHKNEGGPQGISGDEHMGNLLANGDLFYLFYCTVAAIAPCSTYSFAPIHQSLIQLTPFVSLFKLNLSLNIFHQETRIC